MILQVKNKFWEMVYTSINQSADTIRSLLFSLETEWRHRYPQLTEMTRVLCLNLNLNLKNKG